MEGFNVGIWGDSGNNRVPNYPDTSNNNKAVWPVRPTREIGGEWYVHRPVRNGSLEKIPLDRSYDRSGIQSLLER